MPLQEQSIELPLASSIDESIERKVLPHGRLLLCENMRQAKTGALSKRNGYVYHDRGTVNRANELTFAEAHSLHALDSLVLGVGVFRRTATDTLNGPKIAARASGYGDQWVDLDRDLLPVEIEARRLTHGNVDRGTPDIAIYGDYELTVSSRNDGATHHYYRTLRSISTGASIIEDAEFATISSLVDVPSVKAVEASGLLWCIWYDEANNKLRYSILDTSDVASGFSSAADLVTNVQDKWDACPFDGGVAVAYKDATGGQVAIAYFDADGSPGSSYVTVSASHIMDASICCFEADDGSTKYLAVGFHRNPGSPLFSAIMFDGVTVDYFADINAWTANGGRVTGCVERVTYGTSSEASGLGKQLRWWFDAQDSSGLSYRFLAYTIDTTFALVLGTLTSIRGSKLASKAWVPTCRALVWLQHDSVLQSTYYLASLSHRDVSGTDEDIVTIARALYRLGPETPFGELVLPAVVERSSDVYDTVLLQAEQQGSVSDWWYSVARITTTIAAHALPSALFGGQLYLGGGHLGVYDGSYQDSGFLRNPENITEDATRTTGGSMSDGVYGYKAVYEWIDRNGRVHRSAPSVAIIVTLSGGTSTQEVDILVPVLSHCEYHKSRDDDSVRIVLYRTVNGGTTYYRLYGYEATNDPTTSGVIITDDNADASITGFETLYTTAGTLENAVPSCPYLLATGKNRLFAVPGDDRTAIWFSHEYAAGYPAEFSESHVKRVGQGGDITALAALDDSIVVFKSDEIRYFTGAGPNAQGGGVFSEDRLATSDVGCIDWRSIAHMPMGIVFQSRKGIVLLSRSLQVSFIGQPVEDYTDGATVVSATLVAKQEQVRFVLSDGTALVWDYHHNAWYVWTNHPAIAALEIDGLCYYVDSDGRLFAEADGTFTEYVGATPAQGIDAVVETSWIKLAGLKGYQRLWWAYLLGEYRSAHTLTLSVYYDYVDTVAETAQYTVSASDDPYLLRFKPERQKCTAIKFRLEDSARSGTQESFELNGLRLIYGTLSKTGLKAAKTL